MMRFGCLASLAFYIGLAVLLIRPALFPIFVMLLLVIRLGYAVISDPDWPLY